LPILEKINELLLGSITDVNGVAEDVTQLLVSEDDMLLFLSSV